MPYSDAILDAVERAPEGLHKRFAKAAIDAGVSVSNLAKVTGATRATVYRWLKGNDISPAYRQRVAEITSLLTAIKDKEEAWKLVTARFLQAP